MSGLVSLSCTSRRLREFVLPLLWGDLEVHTIKCLGSLRQMLRGSPSLPKHVKYFHFEWDADGDFCSSKLACADQGSTLLELAFTDRLQMWESMRVWHDAQTSFGTTFQDRSEGYFILQGKKYTAPGAFKGQSNDDGQDLYYNHSGGKGPDGQGEDKRIKNSEQLVDCLVEVITQLTSLRNFIWLTPLPMPAQVVSALAGLGTLVDLDLWLLKCENAVYDGK